MTDVLLLVDVFNDFEHDDGDRLLVSFRRRLPALRAALDLARASNVPVVYVNDGFGAWNADRASIARLALGGRAGADFVQLLPRDSEPLLIKPRYSAFDHTALSLLLEELGCERLLLAGASTEGCIVQTGINARELGYKVTILTDAASTVDERLEQVALRYAENIAGIRLATADGPALDGDPGPLRAAGA